MKGDGICKYCFADLEPLTLTELSRHRTGPEDGVAPYCFYEKRKADEKGKAEQEKEKA